MAIVRKRPTLGGPITAKGGEPSVTVVPSPKVKAELFEVPTERSVPSDVMSEYTWLIYGPKKIGKTSLAAEMDSRGGKVLFVMFEPGGKALSLYQTPVITDWSQMRNLVAQLEVDTQGYTTIVLDPGNIAYKRCLDYVSRARGIAHPGMMKDYGASWDAVNMEFQMVHSRIAALGLSFIVLAHDKEAETERRDGTKYNKLVPVMSGSTEEFYAGTIDIICYYEYVGSDRYLRIRGDEFVQAGCRVDGHFLTPSGEPVVRIPAGSSPKEAFSNIVKAFQNKQVKPYSVM